MKKSMKYILLSVLLGMGSVSVGAYADAGFTVPPVDKSDKLIITDTKVGTGAEAADGKRVSVHYTGWLYDAKAKDHKGKKIDSSRDHNNMPYSFVLGKKQVIDGWDQGLVGMKVGGLRTLVIPGHLGYGSHGAGEMVPPNAKLVFDVELLDIM